ncbi:hypothetical protein EIP91_011926 [Steccherinum ochraceum]|uniref:J domain-containing protein n=1 Tax=Steccherinum ochraceum TaxID=92696 RepID=A0A4R0RVD4_9APHY|nr:hypothetical protein EIP91_011926 [Steccherinum ochraceum]
MSSTSNGHEHNFGPLNDKDFLYAVLNLPKTASEHEVRDRYKQLSIVFHPDKQHDEQRRATAVQRFLEVQKAYEVLSDPVRRQAYDLYGPDGLTLVKETSDLDLLSMKELEQTLEHNQAEATRVRLSQLLRSGGTGSFGIDLSAFTDYRPDLAGLSWRRRTLERWQEVPSVKGIVQQTIQTDLTPATTLKLSTRGYTGRLTDRTTVGGGLVGTVRHQFSPRLAVEAEASLLTLIRPLKLKLVHDDDDNTLVIQPTVSLPFLNHLYDTHSQTRPRGFSLLPLSITYSRRLFPSSNTRGTFAVSTPSSTSFPALSLSISSAHPFDFTQEADRPSSASGEPSRAPSRSGLSRGAYFYNCGLSFNGPIPGCNAEYGIAFAELGVQLKTALQLAIGAGLTVVLGAAWSREDRGADAEVSFGSMGVQLKLGFDYIGHRLELPVVISHEDDVEVAFWTTLVPTTVFTLAYHFILRPLERKRRIEFFRELRRELRDTQSELSRQTEETIYLLKDLAKRHMQTEAAVDGLVILEASYGAAVRDSDTEGLEIDVTIPLQALVSKSQLYIPGRRSKVGLQGFRDPVPGVAKTLRVRYTFRGREHYAEIPDFKPTVLPLEAPFKRQAGSTKPYGVPNKCQNSIAVKMSN